MFRHYLKVALRNLLKYKVQNTITTFCLAIGVICFSVVTYYIRTASYDADSKLPHYKQMATLKLESSQNGTLSVFDSKLIQQLENESLPGIDKLVLQGWGHTKAEVTFIDEQSKELHFQLNYNYVNEAFFAYKDLRSVYTSNLPSLKKGEVVLTESCAKLVFGQEDPIGKKVILTRRMHPTTEVSYYTISAVIKEPHKKANYWKVNLFFSYLDMLESEHTKVDVILTPHQSANEINERLKHRNITHHEQTFYPKVEPLYLSKNNTARNIAYFLILLIASLVLIAGLINFLKFSIQSFYNRMRELGLRKCLGSSSSGLFMILFTEIFIMLLVSLLVSMALSEWLVPYLYTYLPQKLAIEILIDMPDLFALQTAIISVTMLLCSAIAWIVVMHIRHISIRQNIVGVGQYSKHFFRNAMIGLQLAIGIFFASSAMGIKQIANDTLNRSYMPLPIDEYKERLELKLSNSYLTTRSEEIHALLKQLPDVIATVLTQPARYIEYRTKEQTNLPGSMINADEHFLSFFRIQLLRGDAPKTDSNDVIYISEAFDTILRKDSVQGTVKLENRVYRIGGVYKALPNERFINSLSMFSVYKPTKAGGSICLEVKAGKQKSVQQQIESICHRYVPETIPLEITTMYHSLSPHIGSMYMVCDLSVLLAFISLLICLLGIYSAISLDTQSRQKEMAIRKINGATATTIAILFAKLYLVLFAIAFAVAFPLFLYAMNSIENGGTTLHLVPLTIKLLAGILALILATISYKIYQIMKQNPAEVIKNE